MIASSVINRGSPEARARAWRHSPADSAYRRWLRWTSAIHSWDWTDGGSAASRPKACVASSFQARTSQYAAAAVLAAAAPATTSWYLPAAKAHSSVSRAQSARGRAASRPSSTAAHSGWPARR